MRYSGGIHDFILLQRFCRSRCGWRDEHGSSRCHPHACWHGGSPRSHPALERQAQKIPQSRPAQMRQARQSLMMNQSPAIMGNLMALQSPAKA